MISGVTASSSSIIGLLDRSDAFMAPSFRSPVVQDPTTGTEQFNIAAKMAADIIAGRGKAMKMAVPAWVSRATAIAILFGLIGAVYLLVLQPMIVTCGRPKRAWRLSLPFMTVTRR